MKPGEVYDLILSDPELRAHFIPRFSEAIRTVRILLPRTDEEIIEEFRKLIPEGGPDLDDSAIEEWILPEDQEIMRVIFENYGAVYGGYLRDVRAGVIPNDLDVVIPEANNDKVFEELKLRGYTLTENPENGTTLAQKDDRRDIEILLNEDPPGVVKIGPSADPDYSVNLLAFDGRELYDWVDPSIDVQIILDQIDSKMAMAIGTIEKKRKEKFSKKGYKTIKNTLFLY